MKKIFYSIFCQIVILFYFSSCFVQEVIIPVDKNKAADVSFSLQMQDIATRVVENEDGKCKDYDDLIELSSKDKLMVSFTIENKIYLGSEGVSKKTFVRKIKCTTEGLVAEPVALAMGNSKLTKFVVYEDKGKEQIPLYSAIGDGSDVYNEIYSKFMDKKDLLPMTINVPETGKFKKILCPIVVGCATNRTAEDFGFKMWDINFIKRFNIPYVVNNCVEDGLHFVASGKINVYNSKIDEKGRRIEEKDKLLSTSKFGKRPANLWIFDNYSIKNENEWYYIEIILDPVEGANTATRSGWVNVEDALKFDTHPDFITELNILDINLCSNTPSFVEVEKKGTYWIEDLWGIQDEDPDLDYNDLIIEYTYKNYYVNFSDNVADRKLHRMDIQFKYVAMGAGNINAFAMRFNNLSPDDIDVTNVPYMRWQKDGKSSEWIKQDMTENTLWDTPDCQLFTTDLGVLSLPIEKNLYSCFEGMDVNQAGNITNTAWDEPKSEYLKGSELKINITFPSLISGDVDVSPMLLHINDGSNDQTGANNNNGHEINMPGIEPSSKKAAEFYPSYVKDYVYDGEKYVIYKDGRYAPWILDIPDHNVKYASEGRSLKDSFTIEEWGKNLDFSFPTEETKWYKKTGFYLYKWYPVVP